MAIKVPSDTSGGWMPKPRKLRPVSARMAEATLSAASMIRMDATLGTTCPTMMRRLETPIYRAARMNSRSRKLMVMPRTMRELTIQPNPASSRTSITMFAESWCAASRSR